MKKPSLKTLIASYHRAERRERQTRLRRQQRLVQIEIAARRKRTQINIVLGADTLKFARGEMSYGEFRGRIEVAQKGLNEIEELLASVGLGEAGPGKIDATEVTTELSPNPKKARKPIVTVSFWSMTCEELRKALPAQCGLRYQPDEVVWRGRADRALVEKIIEQHGETGRVRFIA